MMAKKQIYKKRHDPTPVEEPWIVVGGPDSPRPGRPIYLTSEMGITEERARELAARVHGAIAIPKEG